MLACRCSIFFFIPILPVGRRASPFGSSIRGPSGPGEDRQPVRGRLRLTAQSLVDTIRTVSYFGPSPPRETPATGDKKGPAAALSGRSETSHLAPVQVL